jgi:hypothetical protein
MLRFVVLFSLLIAVGHADAANPPAAPLATGPLTIDIYDQPDFKGRKVTLTQPTPDLSALKFDDKVASFTINGPGDWVLCEHRNYGGRCIRVQAQAENLKQLALVGRVSSLYPAPQVATPAKP